MSSFWPGSFNSGRRAQAFSEMVKHAIDADGAFFAGHGAFS
jgi:hypothetical protein